VSEHATHGSEGILRERETLTVLIESLCVAPSVFAGAQASLSSRWQVRLHAADGYPRGLCAEMDAKRQRVVPVVERLEREPMVVAVVVGENQFFLS
jgi:hypothetical protein